MTVFEKFISAENHWHRIYTISSVIYHVDIWNKSNYILDSFAWRGETYIDIIAIFDYLFFFLIPYIIGGNTELEHF